MEGRGPRGHTGQKVEEAGTYKAGSGRIWSYVRGDQFRDDPETGKATVWSKSEEPENPGGSR